jgi:hypothetical protein
MRTCQRCAHTQEEPFYCQKCGGDLHAGESSKEQLPSSQGWGDAQLPPPSDAPAESWGNVQWDVAAPPPPPAPVRARKRADRRNDDWTRCAECGVKGMPETRCRNCGVPIRVMIEA